MQGSTKAIPKELEPLAAEARKYDGIRSVADGAPGFYRVVTNKIENGNYVTFQISANRLKAVGINSKEELIDFYNQATGGMPKGKPPFEAFGAGAGIETDEEGETEVDPLKAAVGVAAGSLLRRKVNVPDIDVTTPIGKLITAIRGAGKPTKALEAAQSAERSRRAGAVAGIFGREQGQRGFYQALGKLKGPLAERPSFEPVMLEQGDVDTLFNQVQTHPDLDIYDKVNASAALDKLLKGELPQRNQLALLEDIFGRELAEAVLSKRPFADKLKDVITEAVNVPRSLITSFDMSAPLRQGILLTTTKPRAAAAAGREMFRQVFSPQNFKAWFKELPKHPLYREMKDSGLYISDPTKAAGGLAAKEEAYMTNLAQKIPFVGAIVRASERAYVSYLNKLRVDVFTQLTSRFAQEGIADPDNLKSLAAFINNATGRGDLGMLNRSAQVMNNVFFSPRLVAARFQMLNPVWYARQTPRVRREAIKNFAQFVLTGSTVLALFKFAGADVETDPRSTDFGKIRIDNTRWDIWGGFQQWVRVYTQLATGERKTTKGDVVDLDPKKFPFESRLDVAARFLRGKLAPVPALSLELMEGQKLFGEELSVSSEIYENTVPLYIQDMGKIIDDLGPSGLLTAGVPAFFGVGVQNYQEKSAVNRFNR